MTIWLRGSHIQYADTQRDRFRSSIQSIPSVVKDLSDQLGVKDVTIETTDPKELSKDHKIH